MGNILKAITDGALDSIKSPLQVVKDVGKGDFSKAFKDLKHIPGNQERANKDILQSAGIRGWVGDHPGESAAAIVGSVFGGAALMGGGAAAAGGAGAAGAGGAAGGSAALGGTGAAGYLAPAAAGGVGSSGTGVSLTSAGALSSISSQAPSTAALLSMGKAGVGSASATAGASSFTPAMLTTQGAAASGGTYGAASAPAVALQTPAAGGASAGSSTMSNPETWDKISKLMNSVKKPEQESESLAPAPVGSGYRGNFNFDRKNFQNQALTQTYGELYNKPTKAPNIKF